MSLRSVKRLKEDLKKKQEAPAGTKEEEEEEDEPIIQAKPKKQFFQMLEADDDEEDEEEENEAAKQKKTEGAGDKLNEPGNKKKKKKKNKKKQKAENVGTSENHKDDDSKPSTGKNEDDKKEQTKGKKASKKEEKPVEVEEEEKKSNEVSPIKPLLNGCLEIKLKLLQYNKELSKYFKNAKFSDGPEKSEEVSEKETKMMKMMKHRQYKPHKKYYLSNFKSYGSVPEKFECNMIGTNEVGQRIFALEPSKKYSEMQESYESMRNTHDPNMLFDFLRQNPFHMEAVYDVGEFFRLKGDYKQANGLMEQVLFLYEESFSYEFAKILHEPTSDVCLSYDQNIYARCFYNCLIKFVDILGKKGCYKAALEYNKFLLKLNPINDPKGALLCLDFNTICARDYEYLPFFTQSFCKEIYKSNSTSILYLPNYLYSSALAKFSKILFPKENVKKTGEKLLEPSDAMRISDDEFKNAIDFKLEHSNYSHNTLLMLSIMMYPNLIEELINRAEFHKQNLTKSFFQDWQKRPWKEIMAHSLFTSKRGTFYSFLQLQNDADVEGLNKIIEIYLERSKIVWNNNDVNQWVRACIGFILNKIEEGFNYEEFVEGLCSLENIEGKKLPFQLGRYKHLTKHNFSDYNERLDLNNIPDVGPNMQANNVPPQGFVPVNTNGNLLSVVLQSILPWYYLPRNGNQQNQQNAQDIGQEFENIGLDDDDVDPANFM